MKLKKRIEIQQKIINGLQEEKHQLLNENKRLQTELDSYEQNIFQKEENLKFLEAKLAKCIDEYEHIISSTKEIQDKYNTKLKELLTLKKQYENKMKGFLREMKKDLR